ncbi:Secreted protein (modular protein) [Corynebacterium striatum]|nr:Secreted protein (modular protein) [Corynebacterium striatum]
MQALKIPATLLGVPRECLVVGAHPFLFRPVLAPPLNGIGVVKVGKGGVVKRGVLGQVLPVYLHHQQLSHQVQIVAGRQRACCRQVSVRPELGMRLGGANVFNEVLAQAVPAMRGVNKKLHILPGHSGDTDYLLAFLGEVMLVFQARIAQAKQELLGQGRDAICLARLLGTSAYLVCEIGVLGEIQGFDIHAHQGTCGKNRGVTVLQINRHIVRLGVVALVGGIAWLSDSAVAMHAEHTVAQESKAVSRLENTPDVYIGGIPYTLAALTKEIPYLEVQSLDVEVPKLGMVNASTTMRDISITPQQVFSGKFEGAPVSTYTRGISLDGVALGRLLGITDLSIANPDNISPIGGTAAEAELTGTLPGDTKKSTAKVALRLVGEQFHMNVYDTEDPRLIKAFTLQFDTRELPLPAQATSVKLHGGSITFEVQRRNIKLKSTQLSPLEIEGSAEKAVKDAEQKAEDTAEKVNEGS